jgi:hypothetical protein
VLVLALYATCSLPCTIADAEAQGATVAIAPASARASDAHVDRVLLVPTAETHPAGTLFLTSYEVVIPSIGYAITDDVQISATGLTDFDNGGAFELRIKANVLRARAVRVALGTSLDYFVTDPDAQDDPAAEHDFLLGRADAALQLCFDEACRSSVSSAVTAAAPAQNELIFPIALGLGVTVQGSSLVTLLIEYGALLNAADDFDLLPLPLHLVSYGARLTWSPRWALDLGFVRSLSPQRSVRTTSPGLFDVLGLPLLALTYRFAADARSSTTYP